MYIHQLTLTPSPPKHTHTSTVPQEPEDPCDQCAPEAMCVASNNEGLEECVCRPGYKGDGKDCESKLMKYNLFFNTYIGSCIFSNLYIKAHAASFDGNKLVCINCTFTIIMHTFYFFKYQLFNIIQASTCMYILVISSMNYVCMYTMQTSMNAWRGQLNVM